MSIRSTKNGSTPIFYYSKVGASSLNVVNQSLDTIYELPKVAPTENGQVIAVNTDGSSSFVSNDANQNAWINDQYGVSTTNKLIPFTDDTPNGLTYDPSFSYEVYDNQNFLTVGAAQVISSNNNMKLDSTDYILTNKDFYIQGTEDVQRYLTIGRVGLNNNVKVGVDITSSDFICNNELASKTQWKGASEYDFDNDVKIGDNTTSKKLYLNDVEITPSGSGGVSAGMLRALSLNLIIPTVAQTYDVVWSNLTPEEQLLWKGGDAATSDPISSATGNYWSFVKSAPSTNKINWTLPIDLSAYTFQDLQSVWAIVRINNNTTINAEGQLWFQIQTSPPTAPNFYRTRWNYSNSATPMNQFQYFYKIHALDTITTTTTANFGRGQEVGQTKFKGNPCDVEPNLWSIGLNKFVGSPTGDTTAGYTQAPILSVALNTASNIHTYNFDVVAIGVNNIRYNLFFA